MRKIGLLLVCGMIQILQAQNDFKVKFRSRALLDAAITSFQEQQTQGYYKLEDFRVGFKAEYKKFRRKG